MAGAHCVALAFGARRAELGRTLRDFSARGGLLAWKERGDLIRARKFFERLSRVDGAHPALMAFEAQIGEKLSSSSAAPTRNAEPAMVATPAPAPVVAPEPVEAAPASAPA